MNTRRTLIMSLPAILVACSGTTNTNTVTTQIVTDVHNAVVALSNQFAAYEAEYPNALPSAVATKISADLAQASTLLAQLESNINVPNQGTVIQQIVSVLTSIVTVAASVSVIPAPFSLVLTAVATLLPFISSWLGTASTSAKAREHFGSMPLPDAEKVLAHYAG